MWYCFVHFSCHINLVTQSTSFCIDAVRQLTFEKGNKMILLKISLPTSLDLICTVSLVIKSCLLGSVWSSSRHKTFVVHITFPTKMRSVLMEFPSSYFTAFKCDTSKYEFHLWSRERETPCVFWIDNVHTEPQKKKKNTHSTEIFMPLKTQLNPLSFPCL